MPLTQRRPNHEIMLLYKKEKVNPLSGCLPMLLPLPVFFALYSLFQGMVELRGESFLWIEDLTRPDVIYTLPFGIPFLGRTVHILPILMVVSQLVQSIFLTPSTKKTDGNVSSSAMRQQVFLMKYVMPIFFFFICWPMPSALVLFWTVQNLFSITQSMLFLNRRKKA